MGHVVYGDNGPYLNKIKRAVAGMFPLPEATDIVPACAGTAAAGADAPAQGGLIPGKGWWLPALLLALMTFAAYLPAVRGEFIWDDDLYAANPVLTQPKGLFKIWTLQHPEAVYYRGFPVVYTTFWLERRLWGLQPMGYHLVNIAFHALNAILAWLLLKRMRLRGAWIAAAIFALHPVHVESVAWISERKNVLSGMFYLLALGSYLRFEDGRSRAWYLGSLALFLAALLSKPVTCTLPVILLLLRWLRGLKIQVRNLAELLPFFLLALGIGLSTLWVEVRPLEPEVHLPLAQRVLLAGRALWFYPMKLAWPASLAFSYERWNLDARSIVQWLWVLGALGAGGGLWRARERLGRGFLAGVGFYLITISPLLGFVSNYTFHYSFVADHYQYLSSLGLIAVGVGSVNFLLCSNTAAAPPGLISRRRLIGAALGFSALFLLGLGTWRQAGVYENPSRIWIDTIKKNPASWLARNNLGFILAKQGKFDEAVAHYRTAIKLKPDLEEAHNNLGIALVGQGKPDEAILHYREAVRLKPDYANAYSNWGLALAGQGKLGEAVLCYREALRLKPGATETHNNLGIALARQGKFDEAVAHYRAALKMQPDFAQAYSNLGVTMASMGRFDEAVEYLNSALKIVPNYADAQKNLNAVLELKRTKRR